MHSHTLVRVLLQLRYVNATELQSKNNLHRSEKQILNGTRIHVTTCYEDLSSPPIYNTTALRRTSASIAMSGFHPAKPLTC